MIVVPAEECPEALASEVAAVDWVHCAFAHLKVMRLWKVGDRVILEGEHCT